MATNKKRAAVLAALFVLVLLLSAVFIVHEAEHDCHGEGCAVCVQLDVCRTLLRQLGLLLVVFAAALAARACPLRLCAPEEERFCRPTPIRLKVKLTD